MKAKIGKSFGLALMLALGVIATMLALGMFTSGKVGAAATGEPTIVPTNPSPGANVQVEVTFLNDHNPIESFGTFTIELEGWGVPDSIDEKDILVRVGSDGANPENVQVTNRSIEIELNKTGDGGIDIQGGETAIVVIRKRAGLTAPATAGTYDVTVGGATNPDAVTVSAELTASTDIGGSGTTITVSGKAFADGTASIYSRAMDHGVDDEIGNSDDTASTATDGLTKIKDVNVSSGAFSTQVEARHLNIGAQGYSRLEVVDADGNDSGRDSGGIVVTVGSSGTAIFQVTGTTAISPASVDRGGLIEISLSDWNELLPDAVRIGGEPVTITDEDGNAAWDHDDDPNTPDSDVDPRPIPGLNTDFESTFYVKVGAGVALGTKTLVLFDTDNDTGAAADDPDLPGKRLDSTSVEITSMPLSVSPSSAVAGQEITVEGSGFSGGALLDELTVGGEPQTELSNRNLVSATRVTSGGRVVLTFLVPEEVTDGSNTVAVTDADGRIGEVSLDVPEPEVSLDPASSRRGTTVVASGSGFPANEFIDIEYGEDNESRHRRVGRHGQLGHYDKHSHRRRHR